MPGIEDVYELDDSFPNGDGEEVDTHVSNKDSDNTDGNLNRLEVRHAIEARREERRIARELDSLEFAMD